ncbi:type II toxin-antitoxin system RelE/ParE family toxin [Pseudomonas sp. GD03721]|nr:MULTISPECIES: type II toxin-antitoxin system RelE/ParE family toxin [unclassified Pseudomonas]WGG03810.1 type II toxin-antitoxin system RelE/ParE family toxin [Pseudomonas sp. GD03721]WGG07976.1 type II toxin-antitoxin system RelE/ParE family toxin [Pseudomonas sp. GD03919]WGL65448.1 type II toxin-antitoxin system RelE/ParE family toxin [Pseudomonas sp. CW003PS]
MADLVRLREFIAENDPLAAARIAAELLSRIENLGLYPEMGRAVELAPSPKAIRDAVFGKYRVRYSAHTETIVILRIWHHNEDRTQST